MTNYNHILKLFITILTLGLIAMSCEQKPERVKIEYDKSVEPITLEGKLLQSFSVNYAKGLTKESVLKMARQLTGVSGKSLNFAKMMDMKNGLIALRNEEDPSASFEMDTRSGSFLYNAGLAEYKKNGSTPNLITGEKAQSIALQHLERFKLLPNKEELKLVNIGGLNMAILKEDSTTEVYKKLVTVRYNRKLSDVPVMGESRIMVHMGTNGKLASIIYYWGEILEKRNIESDAVLADQDLKKELERRLRAAAIDARRIIVQQVDFVLYEDGKGQIEPAFYVQAKLFYETSDDKSGEVMKYDVPYDYYIPVLKKPLAFYPYMETTKIKPTDSRKLKIAPKDDE